ncbi:MAG: gephyrin-like molybdotransferase Glp [Myxococcaceae bacterium]
MAPRSDNPLLPMDEALARILAATRVLDSDEALVADAIGRTLADDVAALRTLPPWDNSAMDGYAVRTADLKAVPTKLRVVETIFAGQLPKKTLGPGEAARIMTGAPVPEGSDAVVMQERTRREGDDVEILETPAPRQHVRDAGEDAKAGALLLPRGTPLGIPEAALLWAQGLSKVSVPRRPRVAILATGDELCAVGEAPDGRIVDTNSPSIAAAVRRAGGEPLLLGIARDELSDIVRKLEPARGADLIITAAGVSVGERDFVRDALVQLGAKLDFWRIAIRPGKPLCFGALGKSLVFGLPGNPTSSLVTFELFVRPALRRMLGHERVSVDLVPGRIEVPYKKAAGLRHFVRAIASSKGGELWARPLPSQTSGAISSAALATHLLVIPEETTELSVGDPVGLHPVSWTA